MKNALTQTTRNADGSGYTGATWTVDGKAT
jgi:hypothetical protein